MDTVWPNHASPNRVFDTVLLNTMRDVMVSQSQYICMPNYYVNVMLWCSTWVQRCRQRERRVEVETETGILPTLTGEGAGNSVWQFEEGEYMVKGLVNTMYSVQSYSQQYRQKLSSPLNGLGFERSSLMSSKRSAFGCHRERKIIYSTWLEVYLYI